MKDNTQVKNEGALAVIVAFISVIALLFSTLGSLVINNNSANNPLNGMFGSEDVVFSAAENLKDAEKEQNIRFFENEKEVLKLSYEYDEEKKIHIFRADKNYGELSKGHYRINVESDTIEYHPEVNQTSENPIVEKISDKQELYDKLMSLIPIDYIVGRMDNKSCKKQSVFGVLTIYTFYTDDGKIADRFTFVSDEANKFISYTSDKTRMEITF